MKPTARLWMAGVVATLALGCATSPKPTPGLVTITPEHRALGAQAEDLLAAVGETPGREQVNRLRESSRVKLMAQLKTDEQMPKQNFDTIMGEINNSLTQGKKGLTWPLPSPVDVPRAKQPVTVDGVLDDAVWKRAATFKGLYRFNQAEKLDDPKTTWRIAWDDRNLYFAFDCADRDIVAPLKERDDTVYFDDCVEMFILPDFRFRTYWELVIGPSASIYDSVQCKAPDGWGSSARPAENIAGLQVGVKVIGSLNDSTDEDTGYTVEVAVPFDQLPGYTRTGPAVGDTLRFMLVRLDRDQGKFNVYAYQPLLSWGHNVWNHAVMNLVE